MLQEAPRAEAEGQSTVQRKMAPYLMVSLLWLARLVVAPPPPSDGDSGSDSSCATDGSSATYSETIGSDGDGIATRTIVTTTCPNHESMCTGKNVGGCGYPIGTNGDSTEATDQGVTKVVPASPVLKTTYTAEDTKCEMGAIAYALNGVSIFSGAVDTACSILDVEDDTSEWTSFDCCSGHSESSGIASFGGVRPSAPFF